MKNKTNNEFSFVISASGDSWDVYNCKNISYSQAEDIGEEIDKVRGIFENTDGEYIGEHITVNGRYGSNILKLNTIESYEYPYVDEVYENNTILDKGLMEEALLLILEDTDLENNAEKHVVYDADLDYYANKEVSHVDIVAVYMLSRWETTINVSYIESEEKEHNETVTFDNKIKRIKNGKR